MFLRKFLFLAILASFVMVPSLRARAADETSSEERVPSSKHKKKKKHAAKGKHAKKHAAKGKKRIHGTKNANRAKTHAPAAPTAVPPATPQYPTQPNAGGVPEIPNEKKDDLPPPSAPPANE